MKQESLLLSLEKAIQIENVKVEKRGHSGLEAWMPACI